MTGDKHHVLLKDGRGAKLLFARADEEDEGRVQGLWGLSVVGGGEKGCLVAGYLGCSPSTLLAALGLEEAMLCWRTEPGSQRAEPVSQGTVG